MCVGADCWTTKQKTNMKSSKVFVSLVVLLIINFPEEVVSQSETTTTTSERTTTTEVSPARQEPIVETQGEKKFEPINDYWHDLSKRTLAILWALAPIFLKFILGIALIDLSKQWLSTRYLPNVLNLGWFYSYIRVGQIATG